MATFRQWEHDVLEFQKDRNLQGGDLGYLICTQLVGAEKELIEDLRVAKSAASDGLPRIWMRLGRVPSRSPIVRWDLILSQWERARRR